MNLRDTMDRLLERSIGGTGQLLSSMRPDSIPMDVVERDDAFEVRASIPGVKPEDVEVVVQGERLTVRAECRGEEEQRGDNWLMREHRGGTLQRTITLPSPVSSDGTEARIDNGILTLRLPKLAEARPRRITVSTGGTSRGAEPAHDSRRGRRAWAGSNGRRRPRDRGVAGVVPGQRSAILDTRKDMIDCLERADDVLAAQDRAW